MNKAFYKSKRFWGCLATIIACAGDIVQQGPNAPNLIAVLTAIWALYGSVVGTGPLTLTDANAKAADAAVVDHIVANPMTAKADPSAALAVAATAKP